MNASNMSVIGAGRIAMGAAMGRPSVAAYAAILAGWLVERRTLLSRGLEKDARAMVLLKDVLVAGCVASGAACLIAKDVKALRIANRVLVAGAVAATPFINFALFNDYRPRPIPSFFSL